MTSKLIVESNDIFLNENKRKNDKMAF